MRRLSGGAAKGLMLGLLMVISTLGLSNVSFGDDAGRVYVLEGPDTDVSNNDDFSTAQELNSGDYVTGMTGLGDPHRIDTYVLRNVPAGKIINASCRITNFNNQALILKAFNKYHLDTLAWSNREDNPDRRQWEALTLLCVITGDYYLQLNPIAGTGDISYILHVQYSDAEDITSKIGTGGMYGATIPGQISSLKWYPGKWYRFKLTGEQTIGDQKMNDYLYVNVTEPGAPEQRLWGDVYVRNFEPETFSYWLNHSWWLDSYVQYEEVHAAACYPGERWYYLDMQAYNTSGGRHENYELRLTKTQIESDGDNHLLTATPVTYEQGKTTVTKYGSVIRGEDMFDWYKVYLKKGEGVQATMTLLERSSAIFRLSIYRENLTSPYPEKGYDLMSSWTNKPEHTILNRVTSLATNVTQEGWYYIGVIAQIGLVPGNISNLADWTVQTAWCKYKLDITLPDRTLPPIIQNEPPQIVMPEDGVDTTLKLNYTGTNNGVFTDVDFTKEWGEALTFTSSGHPDFQIKINNNWSEDPEATATIKPNENWNGEADITFTATDLYGKSNSTVVHVRVLPVNDPPLIKTRIPDFTVREGEFNATWCVSNLFNLFTDPDMPPFGDDNITFYVDNSTFPAWIKDDKLTFGTAPSFPGKENVVVVVNVTARDKSGAEVIHPVNITVLNLNHPPEYLEANNLLAINEDEVSYFDLNRLFSDPDNDPLTFAYLGGASDNLTVNIAGNGSAVFTPSPNYFTAQEVVRFRAIDPLGANRSGELLIRIQNINDPPYLLPGGQIPDPYEQLMMNEGEMMTFRVSAADIDNKTSELRYIWFVDDVEKTKLGTSAYTYRASFDDAGLHVIKVRISDGIDFIDAEWNITVNETNQPPVINEVWPQNNTEVDAGKKITFTANATDPDNDPLTFYWRLADGTLLKTTTGSTTSTFSKVLSAGKQHVVVLEVQDGRGGVARHYIYIKVRPESKGTGIPGFEGLAVGMALVIAGLGYALLRRKS
ncbi:MAG: tandem-95 repeat protein [Thermoplasmata archaeon]